MQPLRTLWRALKAWGWPGAVALILLLLAGGAVGYEQHCRTQEAEATAEARKLEAQLQALAKVQAAVPVQTRQDWLAALPPAAERQRRLADLLEASIRQGLNATRTEHKLSTDPVAGLERLRVTMPIQGSYAQLRQFIGVALAQDPALSLDSLRLRRPSPQANQVEAELVWSLHGRMAQEER